MNRAKPVLIMIAVISAAVTQAKASSEMKNVTFSICSENQNKCLQVKSPAASGTEWAPLFSFAPQSEVMISNKNAKPETFIASSGYFDFTNHQIVLTQRTKTQLIERSFSTDTLAEQKFTTDISRQN